MLDAMGEMKRWQKALVLAGGTAAAAGLAWYLLRDDGEEDEPASASAEASAALDGLHFRNIDTKGYSIGIRQVPDVQAPKTGQSILPGEIFAVSEVKQAPGGDQVYLRLADGRGWAFTHSGNDGRLLAAPVPPEEAAACEKQQHIAQMRQFMQDPRLMEQVAGSEGAQTMLQNPELLRMMAESNPRVAAALASNPTLQEALNQDPSGVAAQLAATAGGPQPHP